MLVLAACQAPLTEDESAQALSPNPCTAVVMTTPAQHFTLSAGVPVALAAAATCPAGQTPEYQYWVKRTVDRNWTRLGAFVPGASSWTPPTDEPWCVSAVARAMGAPESYQARSSARCTAPVCNNGVLEVGEICDDGNAVNGDACDTNCTLPACGNGVIDPGEQCDDGNLRSGDSCDPSCAISNVVYFKASDTHSSDLFGSDLALSTDGSTLAVGAYGHAGSSGAVYVFVRSGATWVQQAELAAPNADPSDLFGYAVALSSDGATLAVGAPLEASGTGAPTDNSAPHTGAVYVFTRTGTTWSAPAYLKASVRGAGDGFGSGVALSADGATLAVDAPFEAGAGGDPSDNSAPESGAVYVFARSGAAWTQQAYLKSSNADAGDNLGYGLSISADGTTLAVGAIGESSDGSGPGNNTAHQAGAVYVFTRSGTTWSQQAYLKAANADFADFFGYDVSLSASGSTLAVGAVGESSDGSGPADNSLQTAGAVYVFERSGAAWHQRAYLKASNPDASDNYGYRVALSPDGATLAASSTFEASAAIGIGGDQADNSLLYAGAVYLFARSGAGWSGPTYVKAPNTGSFDEFGSSIAILDDGTLAVGALGEASAATGVGGDESNDAANGAGAVYVIR